MLSAFHVVPPAITACHRDIAGQLPDRTGLVAALSEFVFRNEGNILDADQHAEVETGLFFMRLVWDLAGFKLARADVERAVADAGEALRPGMGADVLGRPAAGRGVREQSPHCLYDLLLAHQLGRARRRLVMVDLEPRDAEAGGGALRRAVRARARRRARQAGRRGGARARCWPARRRPGRARALHADPLAPSSSRAAPCRIINIHHSFLPAFVGAQALPPGQGARREGHRRDRALRDRASWTRGRSSSRTSAASATATRSRSWCARAATLERRVLARAVRLHLERRVLVSGRRTIVFG